MAETEAPPATPAPLAEEPPKDQKAKYTTVRKCPHCGVEKAIGHIQFCPKNPNKRSMAAEKKSKAGAKPATKAKKAPAKPRGKPADGTSRFVEDRAAELQGDAAPAEKKEVEDKPAPKKGMSKTTMLCFGLFGVGVLALLWRLSSSEAAPPSDDRATPPGLEPDGHIPGIGDVHVGIGG